MIGAGIKRVICTTREARMSADAIADTVCGPLVVLDWGSPGGRGEPLVLPGVGGCLTMRRVACFTNWPRANGISRRCESSWKRSFPGIARSRPMRSSTNRLGWQRMRRCVERWLPRPQAPASPSRAAVRRYDPRQEPGAEPPHAGVRAEGGQQAPFPPRLELTCAPSVGQVGMRVDRRCRGLAVRGQVIGCAPLRCSRCPEDGAPCDAGPSVPITTSTTACPD